VSVDGRRVTAYKRELTVEALIKQKTTADH
jgi:hypothetical protein